MGALLWLLETQIINEDYKKALKILKNEKFDIIFLDPPYESQFDIQALKIIIEKDMLSKEGIIVLETDNEKEMILLFYPKLALYLNLLMYLILFLLLFHL